MNEEAKLTTAGFQANLENQAGMNQGLFGLLEDLLNPGCRKPTQTKHRRPCQEYNIGLHLRQSLEGQREERGQLGTEEMKWFAKVATERILRMLKSLTSLTRLRTLKNKK